MTRPVFERVAVVGLGLMGGSAALAALELGAAGQVRGVDPALADAGAIPLVTLPEAAAWADLLVLAVPLEVMGETLRAAARHLRPTTLLTDLASVKGPVAELARRHLPWPENCVGAHPMAGGDRTGFAAADASLFAGAPCILALSGGETPEVVDRIEEFWQCLGSTTVRMSPEEHDTIAATLSHAPHLIAFAYAAGLPRDHRLGLAGPGLRDFIRIARANPKLWCEILLMNRRRVAEEAARFSKNLGRLLDALSRGDREGLEEALRDGQVISERLERNE
ncbi:MAG: prephenate dehydrogenase [Deltaproteobacteria bacterium]|nr:prephenate dehydrogenase [Deltaproteobacteria bacterium]